VSKVDPDPQFIRNAVESAIRIGLVAALLLWCFNIVKPFVSIVLWGGIIAISVYPTYEKLQARMRGRRKQAAILFTLFMFLVLIIPAGLLTGTIVDGARSVAGHLQGGKIEIPPPPDSVAGWPLIGGKVHYFWNLASTNFGEALAKVGPQVKAAGRWLLGAGAGAGIGLLKFVASVIIAGVLLPRGEASGKIAENIFHRMSGANGPEYAKLTTSTIRSVARGIVGVALIQSTLAGIGLFVAGIPAAGFLWMVCLVLCIAQLGPGLVMFPAAAWLFWSGDSNMPGILFLVYTAPVLMLDNFLKPIMLGRGVEVPMLIIFLGAIGGFLSSGILGLFLGAIILVVGYTLLMAWLEIEGVSPGQGVETPGEPSAHE